MDFKYFLPLSHRATVSFVSSLWNCPLIHEILRDMFESKTDGKWQLAENVLIDYISSLSVPKIIQKSIQNYIQPMGKKIKRWVKLHWSISPQFPDFFCWTEQGAIDFVKTAKILLQCKELQPQAHFRLLCIYCFEEDIWVLWPEVKEIYSKPFNEYILCELDLVTYWLSVLNNTTDEYMSYIRYSHVEEIVEYPFIMAARLHYEWAVSFFLEKLVRKESIILKIVKELLADRLFSNSAIILLLLSNVTEEQKIELFANHSYRLLFSFLKWPYQIHFMKLANNMWTFLSPTDYLFLIEDIARCVSKFRENDIYLNLFEGFWASSPNHFKKYIITKCFKGTILSRLFLLGKTDRIIKCIFASAESEEKKQMIFYFEGMNVCEFLIIKHRWESLKMFIKECIISKNDLVAFHNAYIEHTKYSRVFGLTAEDLNEFLHVLDTIKQKIDQGVMLVDAEK